MRRNIAFLLCLAAGLAFFGLLRRRRVAAAPAPAAEPDGPPGADELRRKLAASRGEEGGPTGPAASIAEGSGDELTEARAAVHREAHATLDEMRRAGL